MKIDAMTMKEKTLLSVREKLRDLATLLEEVFPDLAEEIGWLCETVKEELFALHSEQGLCSGDLG